MTQTVSMSHVRLLNAQNFLSGPTARGGNTVAYEIRKLASGEVVALVGIAVCSQADSFRKSQGRAIATGRLESISRLVARIDAKSIDEIAASTESPIDYTAVVPLQLEELEKDYQAAENGALIYVGDDTEARTRLHHGIVMAAIRTLIARSNGLEGEAIASVSHLVRVRNHMYVIRMQPEHADQIATTYFGGDFTLLA